jgi:hypothetical protein
MSRVAFAHRFSELGGASVKITSIKSPPEGCNLWSGMAIKDGVRLQWFLELDGQFDVLEEDLGCRRIDENGDQWSCFMNIEAPDGAKEAVLKAIRASLS